MFDFATGKELWTFAYKAPGEFMFAGSRTTPTIDGELVYTSGPMGDLYAINTTTRKPVWHKNIWRDFGAIRRKAGLPKCSMHDLRRSFCTNLSRAIPMHVVQELAGHSDIRTTRRYYIQVEPELMQRACRAVETALAEATETENGSE